MTFRTIDLTGFQPAALRDQPVPLVQWVTLAELVIDERYQRNLTAAGRRHIQRMADSFDWKAFGAISVAPAEGGRLAVVDGQHRAHAAALAGIRSVPAVLVPMTPTEQAAAFFAVNTRKVGIDPGNTYRARLAAGDPVAVRADAAVSAAGCVMMKYTPSSLQRRPGQVYTHGLILKMIRADQDAVVTLGLRAIAQSEAGKAEAIGTGDWAFRVWDQKVLEVWLPMLADVPEFHALDLTAMFDAVPWMRWTDLALQARRNDPKQPPARQVVRQRVEARLRASLAEKVAA